MPELLVENARFRSKPGLHSLLIRNGRIAEIGRGKLGGDVKINANGKLVTESFVVPHLHLDKVNTGTLADAEAIKAYQKRDMDSTEAIRYASSVKKHYTELGIGERARKVLESASRFGVTHMRAFADTDTLAGSRAVSALLSLKREFKDRIDIQVVAFPQEGIARDPGAEEQIERAMELGADVVGGIPWIEETEEEQREHVEKMFGIAKRFDKPVAMLVDDSGDPKHRTLEMLAKATISYGMEGRVEACHARSMQVYPEAYAVRLAKMLRKAGVAVASSPHTGPLHARVDLLLKEGVPVALGQDDCFDAYYPYGRCKMTEVAFLASHLLRMMSSNDMDTIFDMITLNAAKVIGVADYGLAVGKTANLVVLDADSVHEALLNQSDPLYTISAGKIVFAGGNLS
jgi:cytosine deaminase